MSNTVMHEKSGIAKFLNTVGHLLLSVGSLITLLSIVCLLVSIFEALPLLWTSAKVTTHDAAGVLNMRKLQQEGRREFNAVDITTSNFEGSQAEFDAQVLRKVSDPNTIYIAIDVFHRHLTIVGGSKVSLHDSNYHDAVDAFHKNVHDNDYTSATLAALHTLQDETVFNAISTIVFFSILSAICLSVYFVLRRLGLLPKGKSGGKSSSSSSSHSSYSSSSSSSSSDSGGGNSGFASGNF